MVPKPLVLVVLFQLYVCWLSVGSGGVVEAAKKAPIDYDALERAWEAGDAREELRTPGDEQFEALASKSEAEAKTLGPQMVFVTLRSDRESWTNEPVAAIASRWKESLWNGGLDVTVYELEADAKVLVGLQRGARVADLRRFLLEQPEVLEVEWDRRTFSSATNTKTNNNKEKHNHKEEHKKKSKTHKKRIHSAAESKAKKETVSPKPKPKSAAGKKKPTASAAISEEL